jgi:hypothetical protein
MASNSDAPAQQCLRRTILSGKSWLSSRCGGRWRNRNIIGRAPWQAIIY